MPLVVSGIFSVGEIRKNTEMSKFKNLERQQSGFSKACQLQFLNCVEINLDKIKNKKKNQSEHGAERFQKLWSDLRFVFSFVMVPLLAQRVVDLLGELDVDKTLWEDSREDLNNLCILELQFEVCRS